MQVLLNASSVGGIGTALPVMVFVMTKMVQIKGRPSIKVKSCLQYAAGPCVTYGVVVAVYECLFVEGVFTK